MKKFAITVVLGAALLGAAPPALAQTQAEAPRIVVKYGDLNLQSRAGREAFEARLTKGVMAYCGGPPADLDLGSWQRHRRCVTNATEKTLVSLRRTDGRFADIDTAMVLAGR